MQIVFCFCPAGPPPWSAVSVGGWWAVVFNNDVEREGLCLQWASGMGVDDHGRSLDRHDAVVVVVYICMHVMGVVLHTCPYILSYFDARGIGKSNLQHDYALHEALHIIILEDNWQPKLVLTTRGCRLVMVVPIRRGDQDSDAIRLGRWARHMG